MTTVDLLACLEQDTGKINYEQFRTWVVAQSVRNALEPFHGSQAFDPDNPASGEGFISDEQMRVLNIAIRRATHEALKQVDIARRAVRQSHLRELCTEEQEALDFCGFQLSTIGAYMEPPGSPELEKAYQRYISEPDVNREPRSDPDEGLRNAGRPGPAPVLPGDRTGGHRGSGLRVLLFRQLVRRYLHLPHPLLGDRQQM